MWRIRSNNKIRKIVIATGVVSSLTGAANTAGAAGAADGTGTAATFNRPNGITSDGTNLYVADTYNNKIRQIVIATRRGEQFDGCGEYGDGSRRGGRRGHGGHVQLSLTASPPTAPTCMWRIRITTKSARS